MKSIKIVHLYPKEMNIYGDNGNVLVFSKRLQWMGYKTEIIGVGIGDKIPKDSSIIIGGGGQDAGQLDIADDLKTKKNTLQAMANSGVPMLMICGMYQMFGNYFKTNEGKIIPGLGIIDITTIAGDERIIGNIVIGSEWGDVVGYENHSGKTYLGNGIKPLGSAVLGQGNNGQDNTEGAIYNNVFGSYLHGPVLSKNTEFTDHLLKIVTGTDELSKKSQHLNMVDDLSDKTAKIAKKLKR